MHGNAFCYPKIMASIFFLEQAWVTELGLRSVWNRKLKWVLESPIHPSPLLIHNLELWKQLYLNWSSLEISRKTSTTLLSNINRLFHNQQVILYAYIFRNVYVDKGQSLPEGYYCDSHNQETGSFSPFSYLQREPKCIPDLNWLAREKTM